MMNTEEEREEQEEFSLVSLLQKVEYLEQQLEETTQRGATEVLVLKEEIADLETLLMEATRRQLLLPSQYDEDPNCATGTGEDGGRLNSSATVRSNTTSVSYDGSGFLSTREKEVERALSDVETREDALQRKEKSIENKERKTEELQQKLKRDSRALQEKISIVESQLRAREDELQRRETDVESRERDVAEKEAKIRSDRAALDEEMKKVQLRAARQEEDRKLLQNLLSEARKGGGGSASGKTPAVPSTISAARSKDQDGEVNGGGGQSFTTPESEVQFYQTQISALSKKLRQAMDRQQCLAKRSSTRK